MISIKKPKKGLSVIVNTKNEESRIEECLNSVKDWANEIIVVDMSNTDNTAKIAQKLGAKVYSIRDWGWVEPVRNWSINKATFDWVLVLDADERIPNTLKKKIDEITSVDSCDVVKMPWKNIFFNKWIKHTLWWPDYHVRLFKKGHVKWKVRIHPEVTCKGRVLELPALEKFAVNHINAENIDIWMRKINSYTSRENYYEKQENLTPRQVLDRFDLEFTNRYFNSKGYLDGIHGYILSKFMEYYRFLEFAKYWERKGYPELFDQLGLKKTCEAKYDSAIKTRELQNETINLKHTLNNITSSKIYKLLKYYYFIKEKLLKVLTSG